LVTSASPMTYAGNVFSSIDVQPSASVRVA
jgi:hypothetical protein